MILYHGTSELMLRSILRTGLLPISMTAVEKTDRLAISQRHVYLTDCHAPYYAYRRCMFDGCARAAIIEVDLSGIERERLHFDARVLEEIGRDIDQLPETWAQMDRLRHYQNLIDGGGVKHLMAKTGLNAMGSIAVAGAIPTTMIRRHAVADLHVVVPDVFGASDPGISTFTHKLRRNSNVELTNKLFDSTLEIEGVERYDFNRERGEHGNEGFGSQRPSNVYPNSCYQDDLG